MADAAQPGRLVGGRYRLVDRLGAGGQGRVWRAHDQTLGIDVAVKEVSLPFMLSDAQLAERLRRAEREARNTVRLRDQPGIVTVHDVVIDDDAPWIVMQLVSGRSLDEHLTEHGPLSVENTAKVADTMLRALSAAHAAGIVHRDVKPANVLLADDGRVLLTDFGIAQHEDDSSLTMTGAVIGSAEYLAPERARAQEAGPPSDLFSLGVTLYQAVEGISPFRRDSPTATLTAVLFEQPKPPKSAGRLTGLLAALLAKEPGQRPSIPAALAMLNDRNAEGSGPAVTQAAAPVPPAPVEPPTLELTHQPNLARTAPYLPGPQQPHQPPPYLATQSLNPPPPPKKNNAPKVVLAVAAVVVVAALATLGATQLGHHGTPQAGPTTTTDSSSTAPTGTPDSSATTDTTTPTSPDSLDTDTDTDTDTQDTSTTSSPPSPDGVKAGCTEALDDLKAFNAADPAANGGKDFQIAADHDLADKLSADAAKATDPAVKTAIQAEADSWNTFANDYQNNDTAGMQKTIPETTKDINAVNSACNS
ncbi:serine/threonine protein kinase [Catenulispora sp. MAP12-49]|uniref:serine/threonine-protein kinase n=1 Tax=unclassified Catenulispora TaxID=414885 RepID=UPI003512DFB4